jgi:Superinfection immunity protein
VISSLVSDIVLAGLTCVSLVLYLSPLVVGWVRRAPDIGAVAVINILLGWTLVGWVVALAMAFRSKPPGPPPQLPPPSTGASWVGPFGPPALRSGSAPPLVLRPRRCADEGISYGR